MKQSALRRSCTLAAAASALVLVVAGCGNERPDETSSDTGADSSDSSIDVTDEPDDSPDDSEKDSKDGEEPTGGPAFEPDPGDIPEGAVVLHRTGGVAGFSDELTVYPDGTAELTTMRGNDDPVTCTVDPDIMQRITTRAQSLNAEPSTDPDFKPKTNPDAMYTHLSYGDTTVAYEELAEDEKQWRQLFDSMSKILGSATALRSGTASPDGSPACTTE